MKSRDNKINVFLVIDWIFIIVFLLAALFNFLSLFGIFDFLPFFSLYEKKISLLILSVMCFLVTSEIYDRRKLLFGLKKSIDRLPLKSETIVLRTREEVFEKMLYTIKNIPSSSEVLVTHFEKLEYSYKIGFLKEEKYFMNAWFPSIKKKGLSVKQIIQISTHKEAVETKDRIEKFKSNPKYLLNVLISKPRLPYLDLVIIKNNCAFFIPSLDVDNPFITDSGLFFTDEDIVKYLENYFEVMWKCSTPIKLIDKVDSNKIKEIEEELNLKEKFRSLNLDFEKLLVELSPKEDVLSNLYQLSQDLLEISRVNKIGLFEQLYKEVIFKNKHTININRGEIKLDLEGILFLIRIFNSAKENIECTSYVDFIGFWTTNEGKKIFEANKKAKERGIKITRIFILPSTSKINDSRISKVLNQHKLICDKVYAVNENKLEASLKSDFLIMDNAFMFLNAVTSQESNLNIVSINKSTVEDYKKRFDSIKISAEEYK